MDFSFAFDAPELTRCSLLQIDGHFVCLSEDGMLRVVTAALRLAPTSGEDADALGGALRDRGALLLILDNLEQVVVVAAALVGRWLALAPRLQVVVTSRESLRIRGEQLFAVSALAVPDVDVTSPEAIAGFDAVVLFMARARAMNRSLRLDASNALHIAQIVRRLDGMPLAIELAAGLTRTVSAKSMRDDIEERFDLLASRRRDLPLRQTTLRRTIDWSWDLLTLWDAAQAGTDLVVGWKQGGKSSPTTFVLSKLMNGALRLCVRPKRADCRC